MSNKREFEVVVDRIEDIVWTLDNPLENCPVEIIVNNGFIGRHPLHIKRPSEPVYQFRAKCMNDDIVIFITEAGALGCRAFVIPETSGKGVNFEMLYPGRGKIKDVIIYETK